VYSQVPKQASAAVTVKASKSTTLHFNLSLHKVSGFNGFYYDVPPASGLGGIRAWLPGRPRARADKRVIVNDPARMGVHPFLPGTSFYGFDGFAHCSALGLDKKLFQIALGYWAKNKRRLTQIFLDSQSLKRIIEPF
jgi:hypothetical protein